MNYFQNDYYLYNSRRFHLLKAIIIFIMFAHLYLYVIFPKSLFSKMEIKENLINETKYLNDFYKEKIQSFQTELDNMKILNSEYLKLVNDKTLLINQRQEFEQNLLIQIRKVYSKNNFININEVEASIIGGRKWERNENKSYEINLGFQLDPGYILRTMMTLASIMDSQKEETKIRFHFAVVLNFTAENMLKIYSLREKIRDDVEFNFYNAKRVEEDFKGVHPKGPGAIAKILLPHILPEDIDRIILFDTGDLLVLRDLKEMYNWNMGDYLYLGAPDTCIGQTALISKKPFDVYINIGHFLLNVKKIKEQNMYEKYLKYKDVYKNIIADQDLMNDVAQNQIGYLPVRFGLFSPFVNDNESDDPRINTQYEIYKMTEKKLKNKFPYIPKNTSDFFRQSYNPVVIHQWNGKWGEGNGLSIYRRLAHYYMRYAGVYDELCKKIPLFCKK